MKRDLREPQCQHSALNPSENQMKQQFLVGETLAPRGKDHIGKCFGGKDFPSLQRDPDVIEFILRIFPIQKKGVTECRDNGKSEQDSAKTVKTEIIYLFFHTIYENPGKFTVTMEKERLLPDPGRSLCEKALRK